jgi:coproporphyrinogen III oxidase-like Fe-S oxidoreductase
MKIDIHMNDLNLHTDPEESTTLANIIKDGFTYSQKEKLFNETRLSILEDDIQEIKNDLAKYEIDGRLQTPNQKRKLIREVVELYLSEYNKNDD